MPLVLTELRALPVFMTRLTVGGLLAFIVAGCTCDKAAAFDAGPADAGPKVQSEKEPNDRPDNALELLGSSLVEANLSADPSKPDEDWYVLKSALPRTVELTVSCPPGADIALEVMDETRTSLALINAEGVGKAERLPNLDVSGRAFVRVTAVKKGAGGAYTFTALFKERQPGFELEPNDRRIDATAVPLGASVSGFVAHPNDQDWYRFELPSNGLAPPLEEIGLDSGEADAGEALDAGPIDAGPAKEVARLALRIEVSATEGVAFDVQVMTEAEAVLFAAKSKDGAGLSLRNVGVRETDRVIYVVVKSAWVGNGKDAKRGYHPSTYYTLTVAQEEAGASSEFEPNDDLAHATPLSADSYREGFLSSKGDVDCFKLETGGASLAKVTVTGVEKIDLVLTAMKISQKGDEALIKANDGLVKEPETLNNVGCNKVCYFRVEAAARKVDGKWVKDDENGEMSYRISAIVTADDGSEEREPNSTVETAMPMPLGTPIRGTVFPKKDVDYFLVDLSTRPVKTPLRATVTGILKVDIGLYVHRIEEDGKLTLVQTSDSAKGDKPENVRFTAEPGRYIFEVRDAKNRDANFQDAYQLTVEEAGE
jgi:hypothetical protein